MMNCTIERRSMARKYGVIVLMVFGASLGCGKSGNPPASAQSGKANGPKARTKAEFDKLPPEARTKAAFQELPPEVLEYVFDKNELLKGQDETNGVAVAKPQKADYQGTWKCVGESGTLTLLLFWEEWEKAHHEEVVRAILDFPKEKGGGSSGTLPVTMKEEDHSVLFTKTDYPTGFATEATARLVTRDRLHVKGQLVWYYGQCVIKVDATFVRIVNNPKAETKDKDPGG
jgi:hypothetical protein